MHDKFGFASVFFHSNCRQSPADSRQDIKHVERQTSSIKNDNYSVHLQKLTFDISDYDLGRVVGGRTGSHEPFLFADPQTRPARISFAM